MYRGIYQRVQAQFKITGLRHIDERDEAVRERLERFKAGKFDLEIDRRYGDRYIYDTSFADWIKINQRIMLENPEEFSDLLRAVENVVLLQFDDNDCMAINWNSRILGVAGRIDNSGVFWRVTAYPSDVVLLGEGQRIIDIEAYQGVTFYARTTLEDVMGISGLKVEPFEGF